MNYFAFAALMLIAGAATAGDEQSCAAAGGSFRSGTVVKAPRFAHGQFRKGIELSHTHVALLADQDGRTYDVAIDNVYANGHNPHKKGVPPALAAIAVRDRIEVCGQLYERGVGIHWVHTNCGAKPTPERPDGWVRQLARDGSAGPNLEGDKAFCKLFKSGR
ncbi:MAG: hypothetical protein V4508_15630 [Pseudomonadota bacterium]